MAKLKASYQRGVLEAGCDEAGRGCLAGPVVAAAVILPPRFNHPLLNDSKQLTEAHREILRPIIEKKALAWGVGLLDNHEIDEFNILRGSFMAMHRALDQLSTRPESLLIDGNRFIAYQDIPHHCLVKGDARFRSIAAASVLAKTHRDEMMKACHQEFPHYDWAKNKGYPTKAHRAAIKEHGASHYHRMTFRLLPDQTDTEL